MSIEAIAGFTAAGVALLGLAFGAFLWLLALIRSEIRGLRTENRELREELLRENRELRAEMRGEMRDMKVELLEEIRDGNQRILDALYNHRHDPASGTAVFYPPQAQAAD